MPPRETPAMRIGCRATSGRCRSTSTAAAMSVSARQGLLRVAGVTLTAVDIESFVVEPLRLAAAAPLREGDHVALLDEHLGERGIGKGLSEKRWVVSQAGGTVIDHQQRERPVARRLIDDHFEPD